LDRHIETFRNRPLLRLACQLLDWNLRSTVHAGLKISWESKVVLDALRVHNRDGIGQLSFPGAQPLFREAFDELLDFWAQLETAIAGGLIDNKDTIGYFRYWLLKMYEMKEHGKAGPANLYMRDYEEAYGQPDLLASLYKRVTTEPRVAPADVPVDWKSKGPAQLSDESANHRPVAVERG
jgi:hypothetical protein